jgi:hypothetical protein
MIKDINISIRIPKCKEAEGKIGAGDSGNFLISLDWGLGTKDVINVMRRKDKTEDRQEERLKFMIYDAMHQHQHSRTRARAMIIYYDIRAGEDTGGRQNAGVH